jgi:hypothetical protein
MGIFNRIRGQTDTNGRAKGKKTEPKRPLKLEHPTDPNGRYVWTGDAHVKVKTEPQTKTNKPQSKTSVGESAPKK